MTVPLVSAAEVALGRQRAPQYETGDNLVPYLRSANIVDGFLDFSDVKSMNFTPREQEIFGLRVGDVLVTEGSGSRAAVGASAVWRGEIRGTVCFQNTVLRLRPRPGITDGRYIAWWARHAHAAGRFAAAASGANILHLGAEQLRREPLDLPELSQQGRIADFLDDQVARIDQALAARENQTRLVSEAMTVRLLETVRGVAEPSARRDSGVAWLADLPADYPMLTVASQFEVLLGKMLDEERSVGQHLRPYLRNTNVQWGRIDREDLKQMDFPPGERARFALKPGDLLICEGGQPGRAALWAGEIDEVYYQKALHRARSRGRSSAKWFYYLLKAAVSQEAFTAGVEQTTIVHLTGEQLRELRLPFPDVRVQDFAVTRLEADERMANERLRLLARSRDLLKERKRALITACVTGEFDISTASFRAAEAVIG